MRLLRQEQVKAVFLDTRQKIIAIETITTGTSTESILHPKEIFQAAYEHNAAAIILVHNHPSGILQASEADKQITRQLKLAGQTMSINVLDHVIVTETGYLSFVDTGLL